MRAVILGCGSSGGVPRIGNDWGACDSSEPKNRRRRCSLLVERHGERGVTRVLIDTSPDMREQLLETETDWLDGVLYTHDHADQTHGIDDLRSLAINRMKRVDVYMDETTAASLTRRFDYCFYSSREKGYPAILNLHKIEGGRLVRIEGEGGVLEFLPFEQQHGPIKSLGFRCGGLAYSSDVSDLPEGSFEALEGVSFWILDALREKPHPSHAHVDKALLWSARVKPERTILTNLHIDLDYESLRRRLPVGVEPAYDGMEVLF